MGADAQATLRIKTVMDSGDVISNLNQIQHKLESLKMPKDLTDKTKAKFDELTGVVKEYQNLLDKPHKSNADLRRLEQLSVEMKKIEKEAEKMIRSFDFKQIDTSEIDSSEIQRLKTELDKAYDSLKKIAKQSFSVELEGGKTLLNQLDEINAKVKGTKSGKTQRLFADLLGGIDTGNLQQITKATTELKKYLSSGGENGPFQGAAGIRKSFEEVVPVIQKIIAGVSETSGELGQAKQRASGLEDELSQAIVNRMTEMAKDAGLVATNLRDASSAADTYRNGINAAARQQTEMQQQVANLQQQVKNYFGLDEIFRKIGDLARNAMDTVKELDAAMTETAVVTNFDVSDMWKMLPTYTKNANALGSTIADVYNAATLYYQQGLTTTQSMDLANETLKMARIGGIEAAEATDMMTAALRGFNMEINQTSAQRINDVYSKLAAITAADTKEIGTAMERTASIASSANMDFETTSAFLAQMIETTREAPENLGTAMKTIVARFQELKVDPNTLVDSEGVALDFNRVDKALKTVGISLLNEKNEFRDLDDVFLEIASRWDGMSQAQQRYIATQAAGSRQQSRFIAMMQDYDRTMELVDAAYTAEGAGQAQFEKTLESMDSKLNRLKNAWDQFAMGFMNADFLKVGVDLGTKILDIFEKIITGFSNIASFGIDPFGGIIKSALTATAVFGGLLGMSKLLMAGIGKFSGLVLGEEAANMNGIAGVAYRKNQKNTVDRTKQIEENRKLGIQAAEEYNKAYYTALNKGAGKYEAGRIARETKKGFLGNKRKEIITASNFEQQFAIPFEKQMARLDLSDEGQEAAQKFINGFREQVQKGAKITSEAFEERLSALNSSHKLTNKAGFEVKIDGRQISGLTQVAGKFDAIGKSANNAGINIQTFASTLYGTPLQPFGMALTLAGQGLQSIGMLANGASAAMKVLTGATLLQTLATESELGAMTAREIVRFASVAGMSAEVAAVELATAAENGNLAALLANTAGLEANTIATLENAAAQGLLAGAAGKSAGAMGLAKGGLTKVIQLVTKIPPQFALIAAAAVAAGVAIWYFAGKSARELESQKDAAAQASQELDTTKQALEAVINDLDELGSNDDALDNLVKGTTEWDNKLVEANAHIIEMMGHYKALNKINSETGEYEYIQTDKDGRMSITKEGQDAIKKQYQDAVKVATANNAIQNALYNNLQDINSDEYNKNKDIIKGYRYGGSNADKREYLRARAENENVEKANQARIENAWKTGIHAAIGDSKLGDTSAIESILAKQRDQLVGAISSDKKQNKKDYAKAVGYEYVGKNTYKDAQGNEIEIDYSTIKEMLPEIKGIQEAQKRANDVQSSLADAQDAYNKTVKDNKTAQLKAEGYDSVIEDVLSGNAEADLDAVEKFIHGTEGQESGLDLFLKQFEERSDKNDKILYDITGITVNSDASYEKALKQFEVTFREGGNSILEQQTATIRGMAGILTDLGIESGTGEATKALMESMTAAQESAFVKITEGISDNLSQETAQKYAENINNLVTSGKLDAVDKIQDILGNVDFTSAISTLEGFKKVAKSADKDVSQIGKDWQKSGEAARVTATAMQDAYTSEDFSELAEDMNEYIKEQGQLDSTKIMEMAESSQSLNRYLKATGASTEGVARAFTLVAKGKITLSELTAGAVAAANAMDLLAANVAKADKGIQKLESKNDTGRFAESFKSTSERLGEYIENGEFGNEDLENVLSQTFGRERWAKAFASGEEGIKSLYNQFTKLQDIEPSKIQKMLDDLPEGKKNADELIKQIQKSTKKGGLGIKDADIASMILQSATNKDINLKRLLETTNKKDMQKAYFEASGIGTINEKGKFIGNDTGIVGSRGDIKTQAKLYSDNKKEQIQYLSDLATALNVDAKAIEEIKKSGSLNEASKILARNSEYIAGFTQDTSAEKISSSIQKDYKAQTKGKGMPATWWESAGAKEGGGYDAKAINDYLIRSGANETQALETTMNLIRDQLKQGKEFTVGGQKFTEEDVENLNVFAQKWQEAIDNAQWETVGKTIGDQIVAALEQVNFNNIMTESGTMNNTAFSKWGKEGIQASGIEGVYKTASENTTNETLIAQTIGSYLAQHKNEYDSLNDEQQVNAINALVNKMNEWNFSPEQMTAAFQGLGIEIKQGDITGENGALQLNLDKDYIDSQLSEFEPSIPLQGEVVSITFGGQALTGTTKKIGGGGHGIRGGRHSKGSKALSIGQNNHNLGTFARGSGGGYTIPGRPTLTGEDGEELVWEPKRNQAYMVGTNGPEFANISRDAVVWNAAQTRQIKKNSSAGRFGTGSRGINNFGTMAEGSLGSIPLTGEITSVTPPKKLDPIPVKAKLEVEGSEKGGFINTIKSLFGKGEKGPSVDVAANVTNINPPEKEQTINVKAAIKGNPTPPKKTPSITGKMVITKKPDVSAIEPVSIKATANITGSTQNNLQDTEVTTTAEVEGTGDVNTLTKAISNVQSKVVSVKANVSGLSTVGSLNAAIGRLNDKDIDVTVHKKVKNDGGASGLGKYAPTGWNSLARGTIKKPDSSFSGGPTLTGEEGVEVAWLPKEGKSMLLGAQGPQMVDLPKDVVVWSHEESKKILKTRKAIPLGSYAKGTGRGVTKSKGSELKFFSWIGAMDRSQARIERWSKSIDKAKDAMDRYAENVRSSMDGLNKQIEEQTKLLARQLKAAQDEEKYAKKAINKANKSQKLINVSYNKNSGKKAKSKDLYVKEGTLVKKGEDGYLEIDVNAIKKKAKKKGKNAYQVNQIMEELLSQAQSIADKYNGYLDNSKDTIDEVKDKQRELEKSIQDMFFNFEHSLTDIKELQDKINVFDSFESKISSAQSLLEAQMKAGFSTSKDAINNYRNLITTHINNLTNKIAEQKNLLRFTARDLGSDIKASDENKKWEEAQKAADKIKDKNSADYQKAQAEANYWKEEYDKSVLGSKYVNVKRDEKTGAIYVDLEVDKLNNDKLKEADYNAVKEYYEKLLQDVQDINNQTSDLQNNIASAYGELTSAYSEMDNYAKTVAQGMQENEQETIDSLETLNESLRDAFADLIDSIRRELDKQRKAEQNTKTEKDITNQMNRLAMLRADTSGSNAAQIAQLEKEIAEATGSYEDSLEDQMLDRLQEDADKAAEQRERQITILKDQLEYTKTVGQYITQAEQLVEKVIKGEANASELAAFENFFKLGSNGKDYQTKWGEWVADKDFEVVLTKTKTFNSRIEELNKALETFKNTLDEINKINPDLKEENGNYDGPQTIDKVFNKERSNGASVGKALEAVRKAGYSADEASKLTYKDKDGNTQNVSATQLLQGGYSSREVAKALPEQPKHVVKAVAKVKGQAGLTNLDGIQYGKVDTNGSKKGGIVKDSHVETHTTKNGKEVSKITANKGSTLYVTKLDSKTGQPVGKYTAIPIDKLTESQVKEYTDAKQALKYAIMHTNPGKKINKNFEKLVEAAGFVGKGFKLNNKTTAHIGGDGTIHYSGTKDKELGVYVWDPSAGSKKFRKYDKGKFKDWAKSTNVGMEYKAVLKKKGVKGYATGGLANYTGPAWMDGTPSKPELVLNATDTKNFVALKDVLSEAAKRGMFNHEESNSTGDMTFDININVDKIDSDYDVEQVAKKVEKIIVTKAKHRNVTVTGRTR